MWQPLAICVRKNLLSRSLFVSVSWKIMFFQRNSEEDRLTSSEFLRLFLLETLQQKRKPRRRLIKHTCAFIEEAANLMTHPVTNTELTNTLYMQNDPSQCKHTTCPIQKPLLSCLCCLTVDPDHSPLHPITALDWYSIVVAFCTIHNVLVWLKRGLCRLNQAAATDTAVYAVDLDTFSRREKRRVLDSIHFSPAVLGKHLSFFVLLQSNH